ncbi:conserved hypothetical protein [Perkinsus marinus ATCC 50983]|uniref:Calmodulin n=1 Tax=Perkinsus marinus (strain ATCC 50983 / TXsc) TaxID=423536 RepID=C5LNJ5_PERM5|nr:conserved hypothetical protein [Perkinsus marinus ATCC 50983]EER01746.1 conserved hypothetical protein [Perkinsus marinus ATCC 50983]|eukprot:XP_002769028.1 conserved hypothetical protein [Perkinsus marinus ATCC 50983]
MRPKDAAKLAMSMKDLGIDPLDFVPRTEQLSDNNNEEEEEGEKDSNNNNKKKYKDKWALTDEEKQKYSSLFMASDPKRSGYITGKIGKGIFEKSKLSKEMLSLLWELADQDKDGKLNLNEFIVAMQLISKCKTKGYAIPAILPKSLQEVIGESIPIRSLIDNLDNHKQQQQEEQQLEEHEGSSPMFGDKKE